MTTLTSLPTRTSEARVAAPRSSFWDLVVSEWIKLRGLRSTWWTLTIATLVAWGSTFAAAQADVDNWVQRHGTAVGTGPFYNAVVDAFPVMGYLTVMLAAGAIGGLALAGEYGSALMRTTTTAVPARTSVVLAKAVVQTVFWTVAGWITALVSFVIAQAVLSGIHQSIAITYPGVMRAVAGAALAAPVCALVGLGFGALIRHSAATMGVTAFVTLLLPNFFNDAKQWSADVRHSFVQAGFQRLVQLWTLHPKDMPWLQATLTGAWLTYVVWPLAAVLVAVLVVRKRDV